MIKHLRIGLDIDEVIADWSGPFFKRFSPKNEADGKIEKKLNRN